MNWDDLKIFLDVVRQPKLEGAAAQRQMDATTISRRLKRLETQLGLTLFERTRRGHVLTPAGEALAERAERMESMALDILAKGASDQTASGRIRVGAPEGLGATLLAPSLAAFKRAHPQIDVDLIALSGFVSVPKRQADMSVLLTRPSAGRLKVRKLTDYSLHLYGAPNYLEHAPDIRSAEDLQAHTLVGYVDDLIYSSQLRYFDELLPGLSPHLCSPSIIAQLEMVRAGAGLGILPAFMANQHPALVRLLPDQMNVLRSFWLATHEDVAALMRTRALSDFLTQRLAKLP